MSMIAHFYLRTILTTSYNMEFKKIKPHDGVFTMSHTTEVNFYVMKLEFDILFTLSIKDCMIVTFITGVPKDA